MAQCIGVVKFAKFYVILVAEPDWIDKFTQLYMLCAMSECSSAHGHSSPTTSTTPWQFHTLATCKINYF